MEKDKDTSWQLSSICKPHIMQNLNMFFFPFLIGIHNLSMLLVTYESCIAVNKQKNARFWECDYLKRVTTLTFFADFDDENQLVAGADGTGALPASPFKQLEAIIPSTSLPHTPRP